MKLLKFKQLSPVSVSLAWDDGHEGSIGIKSLRDRCPCAGCAGESVILQKYVPPPPDKSEAGRYTLKSAETVGGYALKLSWGDGHNLGLYTWEHLRSLCECELCAPGKIEV